MPIQDGASCSGCGLANYSGPCPHCRGDQDAYERELVPPFESSMHEPRCNHWPGQTRCLVCLMGVKPGESLYG